MSINNLCHPILLSTLLCCMCAKSSTQKKEEQEGDIRFPSYQEDFALSLRNCDFLSRLNLKKQLIPDNNISFASSEWARPSSSLRTQNIKTQDSHLPPSPADTHTVFSFRLVIDSRISGEFAIRAGIFLILCWCERHFPRDAVRSTARSWVSCSSRQMSPFSWMMQSYQDLAFFLDISPFSRKSTSTESIRISASFGSTDTVPSSPPSSSIESICHTDLPWRLCRNAGWPRHAERREGDATVRCHHWWGLIADVEKGWRDFHLCFFLLPFLTLAVAWRVEEILAIGGLNTKAPTYLAYYFLLVCEMSLFPLGGKSYVRYTSYIKDAFPFLGDNSWRAFLE